MQDPDNEFNLNPLFMNSKNFNKSTLDYQMYMKHSEKIIEKINKRNTNKESS